MSDFVVGVDPGLSGALAVLDDDAKLVALADLPVCHTPGKLAWIDGNSLDELLSVNVRLLGAVAVVELVSAMPKQGVASSFQFGVTYGSILSILQAWQLPLHFVRPSQWKRDLQLVGKDKKASLYKARLLYPTADLKLAKHHGRAEALLIAYWWLQKKAASRAAKVGSGEESIPSASPAARLAPPAASDVVLPRSPCHKA